MKQSEEERQRLRLGISEDEFEVEEIEESPCRIACPAGVRVNAYVSLIAVRDFETALEIVKERNPLPGICGRICTHPCESECRRAEVDSPVAIMALKRFIADWELGHKKRRVLPPEVPHREEKIAVVGSGPAGLTAASDLARLGYGVTVFEAQPVAGGMISLGIPAFRLPRDVIKAEIGALVDLGIEIRLGMRVEKPERLLEQGFAAVFLGIGCQNGRKLNIPGEEVLKGVIDAVDFLRRVNLGDLTKPGDGVVVVGGGNSAMDSARTAIRLECGRVGIAYRRTREEMPASEEEVEEALKEGVELDYLVAPVRACGEAGKLVGVECVRMELGEPDESGRPRPVPIPGSEFVLDCDCLISAVGQKSELGFLGESHRFDLTGWGTFGVDSQFMTSVEAVFAGGDAVTGPDTVIGAIAQGHEAASSIHAYLRGEESDSTAKRRQAGLKLDGLEYEPQERLQTRQLPMDLRRRTFDEVDLRLDEEAAIQEALRCMRCGPCHECVRCVDVCEKKMVGIMLPGSEMLVRSDRMQEMLSGQCGAVGGFLDREGRKVPVQLQFVVSRVDSDYCRSCGTCVETCQYDATSIVDGIAQVNENICRGCGLCVPGCVSSAITLGFFSNSRMKLRIKEGLA